MTIDWSDPAACNRLAEFVGPDEYNRLHAEQMARSTVATVNGHAIRKVQRRLPPCHWKSSVSFLSHTMDGKNTSSGTQKFETD